jgi:hypothetical protein
LSSAGSPLDGEARAFMEPRFGHDFAHVRVHVDARAAESARAVGAQAYTVGRHVVFGGGSYAPSTSSGRRLIAHELAHVVQQASAGAPRLQRQTNGCTPNPSGPPVGTAHSMPPGWPLHPCRLDEATVAASAAWCRDTVYGSRHAGERCYRRLIRPWALGVHCPPSEQYCYSNHGSQICCHSSPDSVGIADGRDRAGRCTFNRACLAQHAVADGALPWTRRQLERLW